MLFTCTTGVLVNHLLAKLAISDPISLDALWQTAIDKALTPQLDVFQKKVAWRGLMAASAVPLITISIGSKDPIHLAASPELSYDDLLLHGTEPEILVGPTEECQFRYLTNTENYQALKASLGDLPFQLLIVIARHGAEGILNPSLSREANQDARSLRLRLQKLEAAGLILCKNVYIDKKHTTHSVHVKFAGDSLLGKDYGEAEEDLDSSRDVKRLRELIMAALKCAPNQLRGFSDLKKEFKLDGSHSASKFFRAVCLKLHSQGHIEKLNVELPETKQRLYAIKFVKDIPLDSADFADFAPMEPADMVDFGDSDIEEEISTQKTTLPVFNQIFPCFHQIFQQIYDTGERGITSGEVAKNLMGTADYRPHTRLYELLPTYLSNSKTLKPYKKYAEPYDDYSVSKLYDNEGKLKFYRYFVKQFCKESAPIPKPYVFSTKGSGSSIVALNKKLHSSLGKTSTAALVEKRRKIIQVDITSLLRHSVKRQLQNNAHDSGDALLNIIPRKRRATAPISFTSENDMEIDQHSEAEYDPAFDAELAKHDLGGDSARAEPVTPAERTLGKTTLSAKDLPTFIVAPRQERKRKPQAAVAKAESSLKSLQRRNHLLDIIKEEGGVVFKSSSLCPKLDERLKSKTLTDIKTLARDISHLTKSGELEEQKVTVDAGEALLEKKILLLTDAANRPSAEAIRSLVEAYAAIVSKKNMRMFKKRLIQSDMTLYVEKPVEKKVPKATRRKRGKNRLDALGDEGGFTERIEGGEDVLESVVNGDDDDVFSSLKKSRRAKKAPSSNTEGVPSLSKRPRRNIKLERSETTTLYRCVVISKAFSRDAIDFDAIASLMGSLDGKVIKQKWGTLRRLFGGAAAVSKGIETFQNMVFQGIQDGFVSESDLIEGNLQFFLDFWKQFDTNPEINVPDGAPLYAKYKQNEQLYVLEETAAKIPLVKIEKIDDISMRQKESILGLRCLSYEKNDSLVPKKYEELRSILKAIFSTTDAVFDSNVVKTVLNDYGEAAVREATDHLLQDKEVLFVTLENENSKFILGDRFNNALLTKLFNPDFFHKAAAFRQVIQDITTSGKGLVLSQGILLGDMASLLEFCSADMVELIRIDRTLKFENYESRLIDKDQIACDLIVRSKVGNKAMPDPKRIKVPLLGVCKPVWITLNAEVNAEMWKNIIINILYYVVLKPGVTDTTIHDRMQAVLGVADYERAMTWLIESRCIKPSDHGGYLATDCWQYILGQ